MTREPERQRSIDVARSTWQRVATIVRRTPRLAALSLLIGATIWYVVTDTENPTVVDVLPSPVTVEPVNVADDLAVANQLPAVQIRLSAPADRWERLSPENFRVLVDLNGLGARSQEVPLRVEVDGARGVRVIDVQPRSVVVNLERLAVRQVPVEGNAVGSPPLGYQLTAVTPQVASVKVVGPESLVQLVDRAVADVNVTGLTVKVQQSVPLKAVGAGGAEIRGVRLDPRLVNIAVDMTQSTIVRTVPLTVEVAGDPEAGYRVTRVSTSPAAIQVQGPIELLAQIDRVRLPAVSVNGVRSDVVRSVQIPTPEGLSLVDRDRATVTVTVAPATGSLRTRLAVDVTAVGVGRVGRVAGSGSVEVILEGPLPVLNALAPGEVRATVDASGATTGTLTLPVTIRTPEGITVQSVQPATVTVTIGAP